MPTINFLIVNLPVSLFTREWIEIQNLNLTKSKNRSPSLRGSGLKWRWGLMQPLAVTVSLFTREWIEIGAVLTGCTGALRLPLYEGVD